jgi:predicted AAA+ superfamily ATPase
VPEVFFRRGNELKDFAVATGYICHARGWDSLRADDCGGLWEHLVLDTLLSVEDPARVLFWRNHQRREVDFVVPRGRDAVDAQECKWSPLTQTSATSRRSGGSTLEGKTSSSHLSGPAHKC